jgi:hypothetical protein
MAGLCDSNNDPLTAHRFRSWRRAVARLLRTAWTCPPESQKRLRSSVTQEGPNETVLTTPELVNAAEPLVVLVCFLESSHAAGHVRRQNIGDYSKYYRNPKAHQSVPVH